MKKKNFLFFIIVVLVLVLSACGSDSTPRGLWDKYIYAMNEKNIEVVAEFYYVKDSDAYLKYIEEVDEDEYFNFDKLTTTSFVTMLENKDYFHAEIELDVVDGDANYTNILDVYFIKSHDGRWQFISEVTPNAFNLDELGNKPNSTYYNNIIKNNGDFDYRYVYGGTTGVPGPNDYIKIIYPNNNDKIITIPETIEGVPVTIIGDYAFFDYFRIFSVTFPSSNLTEIHLPNSLEIIDSYAFYQTKNLKTINLPASLKEVKNYAFASSGLEKIIINVDDEEAYESLQYKEGRDSMTILGDRVVFKGDTRNPVYSTIGYAPNGVLWSTSDPEIAEISHIGILTLHDTGTVSITATSKDDASVSSTVTIEIKDIEEKTQKSSTPTNSSFANFVFDIDNVYYTGDLYRVPSTLMSLPTNWSTSDPSVAIVDGNDLKMVGPGTVTITAESPVNADAKSTATITVKDISEKHVLPVFSHEDESFSFEGARDMFVGDYIKLNAPGFTESEIEWSTSDSSLATVGRYNGVITALDIGTVTIRGRSVKNPSIESVVEIEIKSPIKGIEFQENSLDRLNDLKEIYINSYNPNSVTFKGTLKLRDDVKIYVPELNIETYKREFSRYSNNFIPMPEE